MKDEALKIHFGVIIDAGGAVKGKIGNTHFLFGQKAAVMDKGLVNDFCQNAIANHGEISMGNVAAGNDLKNHAVEEITHFEAETLLSAPPIHQHDITGTCAFDEGQNRCRIIFAVGIHHNITRGIRLQAVRIMQAVANRVLVAGIVAQLDDF